MHISAAAGTDVDLEGTVEKLAANNIQLHTFSRYYLGPQTRQGLIFGLGVASAGELRRALCTLQNGLHRSDRRLSC
jgi:hypothetical protein